MYFLATPGLANQIRTHDDLTYYTPEARLASKDRCILQQYTLRRQSGKKSWRSGVCDMTCIRLS